MRYAKSLNYLDRDRNKIAVDWIAVDLDWLERYSVAFRSDWSELRRIKQEQSKQMGDYRVQAIKGGIAVASPFCNVTAPKSLPWNENFENGSRRLWHLTHANQPTTNPKTMPPTRNWPGALAGSALARNRLISQKIMPSAGVLRDQQTLG